jgi:hypothetical protein
VGRLERVRVEGLCRERGGGGRCVDSGWARCVVRDRVGVC